MALWLGAAAAVLVSLAAAFAGLQGKDALAAPSTALAEAEARNQRISFFEARAAADPLDFVSLNVLSGEYAQRARETGDVGDYQRAEDAAERSLAILPADNFGGLVQLGAARLIQHDYAAAEGLARQALEVKPASAAAYGILGDALLGRGNYDGAADSYARMVDIEASLPALSRLANLAFIQGDTADAIDFWQQALSRAEGLPSENRAWAHIQLGSVLLALGETNAAAKENEQALDIYPGYAPALAGLGAVRAAQGRNDEAISLYESAVERSPQPAYVAALGDLYLITGRAQDAETQYALVEAIDALYQVNGISTDLSLALFYADHDRNLERALDLATNAYAASPSIYAADALAWALYKNGWHQEAQSRIDEALRLGTEEAMLYYHAGMIVQARGDDAAARAHLRHAISLQPRFSILHADDAVDRLAGLEATR
jgi:tetratricopeptide (TPR) repeat protein